ncbi:MAG: hypothetical protein U0X75_02125 [Acidobacteriota bacterium]
MAAVGHGTGVIRGLIRVEGGALTPGMRLDVFARRTDASRGVGGGMPAQVDAGGRFQIERLVAGTYEVSVQVPVRDVVADKADAPGQLRKP